ncbi:MAG TPA: acyl-CoA thioesterase II [Steroidobacteraceae bacterium]|nr:acyl-CoA thioesterase II [Steroidobacteraceae bacterium]
MTQVLADLLRLLDLERLEINLFRGESRDIGSPQVFGGQVLGQALMAATRTVEPERRVHSLHSYFLRRGDFTAPIVYEVDRSRDGASFTNRRVVAIQHGQQIFHLSASFQVDEPGPDHQVPAPEVTPPERLPDLTATMRTHLDEMPEQQRRFWERDRPFEFRSVEGVVADGAPRPGVRHVWFRLAGACPPDDALHRCLLAYVSDYNLLETATLPHGLSYHREQVLLASLDHGLWFHRPFRIDDWLLYATISPSSSGARGMAFGRLFDRAGRLVASTAQEGLMRVISPRVRSARTAHSR